MLASGDTPVGKVDEQCLVLRECLQMPKTAAVDRSGEVFVTFCDGFRNRRLSRVVLTQPPKPYQP